MNNEQNIDQLIQIIHEQNSWYIGMLGVFIAIVAIFLTFYSFQQKRISDEQIEKFNTEVKNAQKINEDLKNSNESIIQYSLTAMARENYIATTDWDQRAELYISSKRMFEAYYKTNKKLRINLIMAKKAAVYASRQKFEDLLITDYKMSHPGEKRTGLIYPEAYDKVKKGYSMKNSEDTVDFEYLDNFDFNYLRKLGQEIKSDDIQLVWFTELEKVNNFWINETL